MRDMEAALVLAPTLQSLLSANNEERRQAELSFQSLVNHSPDRVIDGLMCISADWCIDALARPNGESCCGAPPAVRSLCAVLLRRHLVNKWSHLGLARQAWVKHALVASFSAQPPVHEAELAAKLGDCAAELATEIAAQVDEEGSALAAWPELVPALLDSLLRSSSSRTACDAVFRLANELDEPSGMMRRAFAEGLREVIVIALKKPLDDGGAFLRHAMRALGAVLRFADESTYEDPNGLAENVGGWSSVQVFVGSAIDAPIGAGALTPGHSAAELLLREGLEACVDLAEAKPKALRHTASALCGCCLFQLVLAPLPTVRALAVELVVTLAEAAPGMMRKCRVGDASLPFSVAAVDACFELLARRDDDVDVAAYAVADTEESERDERSYVELGADALDRIAHALRPRAVLPRAAERIRDLLAAAAADPATGWPRARAAFAALIQLSESYHELGDSADAAVPYLVVSPPPATRRHKKRSSRKSKASGGCASLRRRDLVETILPFALRYPVAQVRKAAFDALAQTAADHAPVFQLEASDTVLPAICEAVRTDGSARCRAAACRALYAVLASSTGASVSGHLDMLAESLRYAVCDAASPSFVREFAVAALAALASALVESPDEGTHRAHCATLYRVFAETLKPMVASRCTQAALRARALECLALLGSAAGRDVFRTDALFLVDVVATEYFDSERRRPEDDAERSSALKSVVLVASCLEADFSPFLHTVVPALLEAASNDNLSLVRDRSGEDGDVEDIDETFVVRTEALEEQAMAVQLVARLAESLGSRFAEYVQGCLMTLAPLVANSMGDDVRQYAAVAMPGLVACIAMKEHEDAVLASAGRSYNDPWWCYDPASTRVAAIFAMNALLEAIAIEEERDPRIAALQALRATIECASRIVGVYEREHPEATEFGNETARIATESRKTKNAARVETPFECIPTLYGTPVVAKVLDRLYDALQACIQRRAVRLASAKVDVDFDDELAAQEASRKADDEELQYNIAEVLGSLLRTHGVVGLDTIFSQNRWVERIRDMSHQNCLEADRKFAAFVIADLFEFGTASPRGDFFANGDSAAMTVDVKRNQAIANAQCRCTEAYLMALISLAESPPATQAGEPASAARRQAAVYGVGVAAEACIKAVSPYAPALAGMLIAVMKGARQLPEDGQDDDDDDDFVDEDEEIEDTVLVSDNAAASLEKVVRCHAISLGSAVDSIWKQWLEYLPMLGDAEEADKSVRSLCHCIVSGTTLPAFDISILLAALGRIASAILDGGYSYTTAKRRPASRTVRDRLAVRRRDSKPIGVIITSALGALQVRDSQQFQAAWASLDSRQQHALQVLAKGQEIVGPSILG